MMSDEQLTSAEAELQQWIDGLLTSAETLPITPAALREKIEFSVRRKRRRRQTVKVLTAAAAGLLLLLSLPKTPIRVDRQVVSTPAPTPPKNTPVATFAARSDLVAIPLESSDPTVTIIQVYPMPTSHQRWRREALVRTTRLRNLLKGNKS